MSKFPRLMIAGTHSGVGKTTIATAVMAIMSGAGAKVQPYKVGPDFIDPGFHQVATGRWSRNLDTFMLGEDGVREIFTRSAGDADISIIEGVMGLYDGVGAGNQSSSARVAELLQCPVLLVVDARSMAASAAAVVWGFNSLPGGVPLAGVILNRVAGQRHFEILKEAIEGKTGVPVVGGIPRDMDLSLPERHLGLVPSVETRAARRLVETLALRVAPYLSMRELTLLAGRAPAIHAEQKIFSVQPGARLRLGIVMDKAFNFYYRDGLELLAAMGAELVYCSALEDEDLPADLDGLYIGGGFPEMFLEQLSANRPFIARLNKLVAGGLPLFAECGGLMYLCRHIRDFNQRPWRGAGILPADCRMEKKRVALGYVTAKALRDNVLVGRGTTLRGHEFHYSSLEGEKTAPAYELCKPGRNEGHIDGYAEGNVLATYLHIHFAGMPGAARGLLQSCAGYRRRRMEN